MFNIWNSLISSSSCVSLFSLSSPAFLLYSLLLYMIIHVVLSLFVFLSDINCIVVRFCSSYEFVLFLLCILLLLLLFFLVILNCFSLSATNNQQPATTHKQWEQRRNNIEHVDLCLKSRIHKCSLRASWEKFVWNR